MTILKAVMEMMIWDGGPGADVLTGGQGADHFHCGTGVDRIVDYNTTQADIKSFNCEM